MVAKSKVGYEHFHDHHWKSAFYHCQPCNVHYNIITRLEESKTETGWILRFLELKNITHFGKSYGKGVFTVLIISMNSKSYYELFK